MSLLPYIGPACALGLDSLASAAVEAALLTSAEHDDSTLTFDASFWAAMVDRSCYVMARRAGRSMLSAITSK